MWGGWDGECVDQEQTFRIRGFTLLRKQNEQAVLAEGRPQGVWGLAWRAPGKYFWETPCHTPFFVISRDEEDTASTFMHRVWGIAFLRQNHKPLDQVSRIFKVQDFQGFQGF
jgi:hypothetical protein